MKARAVEQFKARYFTLRTPLLAANGIFELQQKLQEGTEDLILRQEFSRIFSDIIIQEAMYIASPDVYQEMMRSLKSEFTDASPKLLTTLFQYYTRMSMRSTPFGLFAGFSNGIVTDHLTELKLSAEKDFDRHCRLDMHYVCHLADTLMSNDRPDNFFYIANSTLYKVRNKIRYIETHYNNNVRRYDIAHVDANPLLEDIIKFTGKRRKYQELIDRILMHGLPYEASESYIRQLIAGGILTNTLEANVTGMDYVFRLSNALSDSGGFETEAAVLSNVCSSLADINQSNDPINTYRSIKQNLELFPTTIEEGKLFQVDMVTNSLHLNLDKRVVTALEEAYLLLAKLSTPENSRLDAFKKAFEKRYETDSVKLTDVMDAEIGINYDHIKPEVTPASNYGTPNQNSDATIYKLKKFISAIKESSFEVEVTAEDVAKFTNNIRFPDSFSVMATVLNLNETAFTDEATPLLQFKSAVGPSSAIFLGRFCSASEELNIRVKEDLQDEEQLQGDKIFAEIAHVPQSRLGNILTRPHLRKYEIVFLANSTLSDSRQIGIDDLYLKLQGGHLVLYSKKLKKEVVPRLSSAHNYQSNSLPIYHFLCDLQSQGVRKSLFWSWDLLNGEEFLPRVRYKNVILSPAVWTLSKEHIKYFNDEDTELLSKNFERLKNKLNIPDKVVLSEGDNDLYLDLSLDISLSLLRKKILKKNSIRLEEALFNLPKAAVTDNNGMCYANEIIVPFTKRMAVASTSKKTFRISNNKINRNFTVGSEWIYFKIYTGVTTADYILREIIAPLSEKLKKKGEINKWFFIRYQDPDFHLRVRFQLADLKSYGIIVSRISRLLLPLIKSGEINNYTLDTYKREVERYGASTMELSESVFGVNSEIVCKILQIYHRNRDFSVDDRVNVALLAVDNFLKNFSIPEELTLTFLGRNRQAFAKEFRLEEDKKLKAQLQANFRAMKPTIESLLQSGTLRKRNDKFEIINDVLRNESRQLETTVIAVKNILATPDALLNTLSSYVHMYINRLLPANNRFNEFLTYDFLERYYRSVSARKKSEK